MKRHKKKDQLKKNILSVVKIICIWLLIVGIYHSVKPLPDGMSYESPQYLLDSSSVHFLYDLTYTQGEERIIEQEIFDAKYSLLRQSEFALVDMFLFNAHLGAGGDAHRALSGELVDVLVDRKRDGAQMVVITDPINTVYGGALSREKDALTSVGIEPIYTNVLPLRDSNPFYSSIWRTGLQWFGNSEGGFLPHPFGEGSVSFRSYLRMLNFKANHRKVLVGETNEGWKTIISSANPHDASSAHSNVAIQIDGDFAKEVIASELAVARMSSQEFSSPEVSSFSLPSENALRVQLLTEGKIKQKVLHSIRKTESGEKISLAMFYLSDRDVVKALISASKRGVIVDVILDPNKDAFGYEKSGIPNRQVAYELVEKSDGKINVRWYKTNGEQFHTKLLFIRKKDGSGVVILGSCNYTVRNLDDYNLETNVIVSGPMTQVFMNDVSSYFERISKDPYTGEYALYKDTSLVKRLIYKFQEWSGMSSF